MLHRKLGAGLLAGTLLTVAGATSISVASSVAGASGKPYRILLLAPLSTTYLKTNAATESLMAQAAVTVENKKGGVDGHRIKLTIVNTGGSPTTAVTKLEAALQSKNKPNMVIQGNASPEASAELPILTRSKVLSFNQAPTATSGKPATNPYNFDISPGTTDYVKGFIAYTKAKGLTKVAIFHGNDAYGDTIGTSMTAGAKAAGLTVTDNIGFKTTGLTFTATLEKLQASKPQILWLDGYGAPPAYTLADIKKLGWTVPMIADDSYSVSPTIVAAPPTGALGTTAEKNLEFETFTAGVYHAKATTPKNTQVMLAAMKRNGSPKSSLLFGYEYDAVILTVNAARSAGFNASAAKVAKTIVKQQKTKPAPTGLFSSYGYTSMTHSANVPVSAFAFTAPTPLTTGLFGATGK